MNPSTGSGEVFISFSSKDLPVRKLFAALQIQNIDVWDYSDEGEELPLAYRLSASLKTKIDECEYFIAVISPNSIDPVIGPAPIAEVRYALESGKAKKNRFLPLLLDGPTDKWLDVYPELKPDPALWAVFDHENDERFENTIRRICEWLSTPYLPSSLKDPRVFFRDLLLADIEKNEFKRNADFLKLMRESNNCARHVLNEQWSEARKSIDLLMILAKKIVPPVSLHYPFVIRGICELQLGEFDTAEQTFLEVTKSEHLESNLLLGLGYAGLGHTYASLERFDDSLTAFQKAVDLAADDYLRFNLQAAILGAGGAAIDESVFQLFDPKTLSPAERLKVLILKGALHYKNREYARAISVFGELKVEELDETSAIYYSLALQENGRVRQAIDVFAAVANRTRSISLYHYLADTYWSAGEAACAISIYETHLCAITTPADYGRQLLIEYAQMVRAIEGDDSPKARKACERAVDLKIFPPPQSKGDFFFTGFAYHLLGRSELARYFYENSAGFSAEYYDELSYGSAKGPGEHHAHAM